MLFDSVSVIEIFYPFVILQYVSIDHHASVTQLVFGRLHGQKNVDFIVLVTNVTHLVTPPAGKL